MTDLINTRRRAVPALAVAAAVAVSIPAAAQVAQPAGHARLTGRSGIAVALHWDGQRWHTA